VDGVPSSDLPAGLVTLKHTLVQYTAKKQSAQRESSKMPFAPKEFVGTPLEWINFTTLTGVNFTGFDINGETLDGAVHGGTWSDIFGWAAFAKDGGSVVVDGKSLHRWSLAIPATGAFELLVDASGAPYRLVQNVSKTARVPHTYYLNYTFSDFTPDDSLLPKAWDGVVEDDFRHPKPCAAPKGPSPVNVTMYIFHPKDEFNISGQDLGDATGDTFFVCVDAITNFNTSIDHHYAWISEYNVQLSPRYGQYQNCNDYPPKCLGANDFWVGHEAAQGLGLPAGGQCKSNPLVGEWWSLPVGGRCSDDATPGDGSCTWKATRRKTIDSPCLFNTLGFVDKCREELRAPFPAASNLLTKAFEEDSAHGGCPALPV